MTAVKNSSRSRDLLAFSLDGKKYFTTGVNDDKLNLSPCSSLEDLLCKEKKYFKAFPTDSLGTLLSVGNNNTNNLIGLPSAYTNIAATYPNDYRYYLSDGKKGLDISTAFFNIKLASSTISFNNVVISEKSIGDGIPDVIVTQTGVPSKVVDEYFFTKKGGYTDSYLVGKKFQVNFSATDILKKIDPVATTNFKFYLYDYAKASDLTARINTTLNNGATDGDRDLRVLALDWEDLGITPDKPATIGNFRDVYAFNQKFAGDSDVAFIAFNQESLFFKRSISGNVKEVKLDGVTRVPFNPSNIEVDLFIVKAGIVEATPLRTASVDVNGDYSFEDVLSNLPEESYRVIPRVLNFNQNNPYYVVENSDGTLNNYQDFVIEYEDVENVDFVLGNFCVKAPLKTQTIGTSTPVAISTLNKQSNNWPNAIPNAALVLDSKEKGLVLPRTTSTAITTGLTEGMIIYDTASNCIKLYDGTKWVCIERDCSEN